MAAASSHEPGIEERASTWRSTPHADPRSLDTSAAASKAREAQLQQDEDSVASSPMSTHSNESIDTTGLSDEEQLAGPFHSRQNPSSRDPPPAYSPAAPMVEIPSSSPSEGPPRRDRPTSYGTAGEPQSYYTLPHPEPDPPDEDSERAQLLPRVRKRLRRRGCCSCCCHRKCGYFSRKQTRIAIAVLAIIILALIILVPAFRWIHNLYSREPDYLTWFECNPSEVTRTELFDFHDFNSFTFSEQLDNVVAVPGALGGKVSIVEASRKQDAAVRVSVDMRSSYLTFLQHVDFHPTTNSLTITSPVPPGKDPFTDHTPCTAFNVIISVNRGLLHSLVIDAPRLTGIEFDRDMVLGTRNVFASTAGRGRIAKRPGFKDAFTPHHIDIKTTDGAIEGAFPLVEETWLATLSGDIDVAVTVPVPWRAALGDRHFHANSGPGNVRVTFPAEQWWPRRQYARDYYVQASTATGSLSGTYLHSRETNLTSFTGNIDATLALDPFPVGNSSTILTDTVTGQTDLRVLRYGPETGSAMDPMLRTGSRHHSVAGGMRLRYPDDWEGRIRGAMLPGFGSVSVAGDGVEVVRRDGGEVEARRGNGDSEIVVETATGACEILVGNSDRD